MTIRHFTVTVGYTGRHVHEIYAISQDDAMKSVAAWMVMNPEFVEVQDASCAVSPANFNQECPK